MNRATIECRTARPRRPRMFTNSDRWDAALADFVATMCQQRLAQSTLARVVKHVRRFAADTGTAPYDVTTMQVVNWLNRLDVTARAGYAYRTSLRTFYGWAYRAGRVLVNPTDEGGPHVLARHTPSQWQGVLAAYQRWQTAANLSRATVRLHRARLAMLARETGAATPWDLSTEDLADWLARHRWARETMRSSRMVLRAFYQWAYDVELADDNPAERLPIVRTVAPNPRPATETDYRAALARADSRETLILRLAAELGLRRGEVARVHSTDIRHDDAGRVWLTVHGKGDKVRRVPVARDLATLLGQCPTGYVFPGNDAGHLSPATVGKLITELLPNGVTMHALRHRFATRAYSHGRDLLAVQRLLGHTSPATTQRYVQTDDETLTRIIDNVGRTI